MRQPRFTFTARSPLDLVAVAPQLLGFHPRDSVVLLTFGHAENFHARVDLPESEDDQVEVVEMLAGVLRHHRVRRVALLLYTDDPWVAATFHDAALTRLVHDGVDVIEVLRVTDECFHDAGDVDGPGTAYDLKAHPFTAEQVVRGEVVLESREQLAASLRLVDAEDAHAVQDAAVRFAGALVEEIGDVLDGVHVVRPFRIRRDLAEHAHWVRRTIRRHARKRTRLGPDDAGRMLLLMSEVGLRDVALQEMNRENAEGHVELWRDLVRRCPPGLMPSAASLLAFAAWLRGNGALAWCALDRCAEVDPGDHLAALIRGLLEDAVPPSVWAPIAPDDQPAFWPPDAS